MASKATDKSDFMKQLINQNSIPYTDSSFQKILGPRREGHWEPPVRKEPLAWCLGVPAPGGARCMQGYLARPVTTVWAQGAMISLKLPWSKNPLCQDPFRAAGRRTEAQVEGPG